MGCRNTKTNSALRGAFIPWGEGASGQQALTPRMDVSTLERTGGRSEDQCGSNKLMPVFRRVSLNKLQGLLGK